MYTIVIQKQHKIIKKIELRKKKYAPASSIEPASTNFYNRMKIVH